MAYINPNPSLKTAYLTTINNAIGPNAVVTLYDGTYPANPSIAPTANVIANFTCNATAFGTVSNTVLTLNQIGGPGSITTTVLANATVGWARIYAANGVGYVDQDVGLTGSNAVAIISANPVQTGLPVALTSLVINNP